MIEISDCPVQSWPIVAIYPPSLAVSLPPFAVTLGLYETTDNFNAVVIFFSPFKRPVAKIDDPPTCGAIRSSIDVLPGYIRLDDVEIARIMRNQVLFLIIGKSESEADNSRSKKCDSLVFVESVWSSPNSAVGLQIRSDCRNFLSVYPVRGASRRTIPAGPELDNL